MYDVYCVYDDSESHLYNVTVIDGNIVELLKWKTENNYTIEFLDKFNLKDDDVDMINNSVAKVKKETVV